MTPEERILMQSLQELSGDVSPNIGAVAGMVDSVFGTGDVAVAVNQAELEAQTGDLASFLSKLKSKSRSAVNQIANANNVNPSIVAQKAVAAEGDRNLSDAVAGRIKGNTPFRFIDVHNCSIAYAPIDKTDSFFASMRKNMIEQILLDSPYAKSVTTKTILSGQSSCSVTMAAPALLGVGALVCPVPYVNIAVGGIPLYTAASATFGITFKFRDKSGAAIVNGEALFTMENIQQKAVVVITPYKMVKNKPRAILAFMSAAAADFEISVTNLPVGAEVIVTIPGVDDMAQLTLLESLIK